MKNCGDPDPEPTRWALWRLDDNDNHFLVELFARRDEAEAAACIPPGATVFLATGGQRPELFAGLRAARVHLRRIDPPGAPCPIPGATVLLGRPPFPLVDEIALFERLGIDWLVTRNAGGDSGRTKLEAARQLGVRVAMIRRPALPPGLHPIGVAGALDWAATLSGR